jgi:hypothetical protein
LWAGPSDYGRDNDHRLKNRRRVFYFGFIEQGLAKLGHLRIEPRAGILDARATGGIAAALLTNAGATRNGT